MRKISAEEEKKMNTRAEQYAQQFEAQKSSEGLEMIAYDFKAGYTECAGNSVSIEEFTKVVDALKSISLCSEGEMSTWKDCPVRINHIAKSTIKDAEQYLNNE